MVKSVAAPAEDQRLVFSIHIRQLGTFCTPSRKGRALNDLPAIFISDVNHKHFWASFQSLSSHYVYESILKLSEHMPGGGGTHL